jgi:hypothetical protein
VLEQLSPGFQKVVSSSPSTGIGLTLFAAVAGQLLLLSTSESVLALLGDGDAHGGMSIVGDGTAWGISGSWSCNPVGTVIETTALGPSCPVSHKGSRPG